MISTMTEKEENDVMRGLDRGLRDHVAQLFRVYMSDKPDSTERLEAGLRVAIDSYQAACELVTKIYREAGFDLMSGDKERVTTGRDYGADEA
jgi:hypothetical protein